METKKIQIVYLNEEEDTCFINGIKTSNIKYIEYWVDQFYDYSDLVTKQDGMSEQEFEEAQLKACGFDTELIKTKIETTGSCRIEDILNCKEATTVFDTDESVEAVRAENEAEAELILANFFKD